MLDSQLMERFIASQDSRAFRDLVERHGPAVLRTCRRLVHDPHEAEDAMQATFLILAQRAPSLRDPEQLDRWLAGVARRVAARARRRIVRRAERERTWATYRPELLSENEGPSDLELRLVVREELGQMPEPDRRPLTLCYLDGLTHEEAADRIGCPVGTIKARLVRARRRLRDRLGRRGIGLGLGLLLFLLGRRRDTEASGADWCQTAQLMDWQAQGDLEAVAALSPRAYLLSRRSGDLTPPVARTWILGAALLFIAVVGFLGIGAIRARTERDSARQISARLMSVLGVDCQAGP